jgi:uncharacterized protein (TIGR03437 family)
VRLLLLFIATLSWAQTPEFPSFIDMRRQPAFLEAAGARAIQIDASGSVYLSGTRGFGEVNGALKIGPVGNGQGDIYVVKMDATLERVLFATLIGGSKSDSVDTIQVDAAGNVYLGGSTTSSDFPFTQTLFASNGTGGFVVKLKADGSLAYAARTGKTRPRVLAVDAAGTVYVGGDAMGSEIPRTTAEDLTARGVVLKLNSAGTAIEFGRYVGSGTETRGLLVHPDGHIVFLADSTLGALNAFTGHLAFSVPVERNSSHLGMDRAGNLYVAGGSAAGLVVRRFTSSGASRGVSTLPAAGTIDEMQVTPDGSVYLEGSVGQAGFPTLNSLRACKSSSRPPEGSAGSFATFGGDRFLVIFRPDGELSLSSYFGASFAASALSPDGQYIYAMASQEAYLQTVNPIDGSKGLGGLAWSGLQRLDLTRIPQAPRVAPACLANAATYLDAAVSPGGLMTVYGSNLGPQAGESSGTGNVPTELSGTRVTVDGRPAPILYAQFSQVNFVVPWVTRTDGLVEVCVLRGEETGCVDDTAESMSTAAFASWDSELRSTTIVLNQDFTLNSSSNPTRRGGYVTLYLTGTGLLEGPLGDGAISGLPLQRITANTVANIEGEHTPAGCNSMSTGSCLIAQIPMEVSYAGSAPGLVAGVTQLNLRIPGASLLGARPIEVRFTPRALSSFPIAATVFVAP